MCHGPHINISLGLSHQHSHWSPVVRVVDRHGGCPNVSHYVRAIPRTGYIAPMYQQADPNAPQTFPWSGSTEMSTMHVGQIRHEVYEGLTPKGKKICAGIKAPKGALVQPIPIDINAGLTAGGPGSNTVRMGCDHFAIDSDFFVLAWIVADVTAATLLHIGSCTLRMGFETPRRKRDVTRLLGYEPLHAFAHASKGVCCLSQCSHCCLSAWSDSPICIQSK